MEVAAGVTVAVGVPLAVAVVVAIDVLDTDHEFAPDTGNLDRTSLRFHRVGVEVRHVQVSGGLLHSGS